MMQYTITKNEAKILRALGDYGEADFYELASMAQLKIDECREAGLRLANRKLAIYKDDKYLRLTKEGYMVQQTLLNSSKNSYSRSPVAVSIVSNDEENVESSLDAMDSEQLNAAFDEEIKKLR